jgi:hypothetical protein
MSGVFQVYISYEKGFNGMEMYQLTREKLVWVLRPKGEGATEGFWLDAATLTTRQQFSVRSTTILPVYHLTDVVHALISEWSPIGMFHSPERLLRAIPRHRVHRAATPTVIKALLPLPTGILFPCLRMPANHHPDCSHAVRPHRVCS